ncbi:MAG: Coenzyme F420 hydrogenase/dehydrogenase, beta subunit C-terminal domain [Methanolinea sp.]|nr:Coenzyme F420 hydrogenase/dehydrogenase, beta subunit C-terminal domain [Methanolinea sp.]
MTTKSYRDLKERVWDRGTCSGCGACVAVCPADAICFDEPGGSLKPRNIGYCKRENDEVPCGACYDACPRTGEAEQETLGFFEDIFSARSTLDIPRKQAGGAVTAVLVTALEEGLIDGIVTVAADHMTLKPRSVVITRSGDLKSVAGSRYNWWVPLVAALKTAVIDMKLKKIAVVGVPCVVKALHRIRTSDNDLAKPFASRISLVIGLFCTETFDYRILVEGILVGRHTIETWNIDRLDVRKNLEVTMKGGEILSLPISELKEAIRPGCQACTDFTALYSDLSAGSVGSPRAYTTLMVRNSRGHFFVSEAIRKGLLEKGDDIDIAAIERLATLKVQRAKDI